MRSLKILLLILMCLMLVLSVYAQVDEGTPIEFDGTIEVMSDNNELTIGGLLVDVGDIDVSFLNQLQVGVEVNVTGTLLNGRVTAITIIIISIDNGDDNSGDDTPEPSLSIEKYVWDDDAWQEADNAPGAVLELDEELRYRIEVTNDGNVPVDAIFLSDNRKDVSSCSIPDTLLPDESFACEIGPFNVLEGQQANTATVFGLYDEQVVEATDTAYYFGGEIETNDVPVIIVIEGPVQQINVNIITIFNIDIELDSDDPILSVIQIGDVIRVEGGLLDDTDVIVLVAVQVVIINVEVFINDGEVWRDPGNCQNAPPPWAPANGWRRRCESGGNGGGGGSGSGSGSDS